MKIDPFVDDFQGSEHSIILYMLLHIDTRLAHKLQTETMIWLTTVRPDGVPLPTPVWFLWDGARFLVFSEPGAHKVRNIAHNPAVALNFNTDLTGEIFAIFVGTAEIDPHPATAEERAAYVAKYAHALRMIGVTPAEHAARWSTALRITPTRIRAQLDEPQVDHE
jgi:PPOX class probable F420-dependent enzyme